MHTRLTSIRQACRRGFALLLGTVCILLLTSQLWSAPALATGIYEMPETPPEGHILDQGDILSRLTEGKINGQLETLVSEHNQNVNIVTIHRLDYGETIDTFAQQLLERWYPTPEARANQTLLIIDTLTDNTGIVQGEASQAAMDAAIAKSVAQETVLVPLKYGNRYNQAFLDATDRMSTVLAGEADPGAPEVKAEINTERNFATPEETKDSNATTWVIVLIVLSTAIPMATYYFYVYMGNQ